MHKTLKTKYIHISYVHNTTISKSTSMLAYVSTRNILYPELSTERVTPVNKLEALYAASSMLLYCPAHGMGSKDYVLIQL